MNQLSPYHLLGVSQGASPEEIHLAYKNRVKVLHPDRFNKETQPTEWKMANDMLRELNEAYTKLNQDQERRNTEPYVAASDTVPENQDAEPDIYAYSENRSPETQEVLERIRYMKRPEVQRRVKESLKNFYLPLKLGFSFFLIGVATIVILYWFGGDPSSLPPPGEWCWQKVTFVTGLGFIGLGLLFILAFFIS